MCMLAFIAHNLYWFDCLIFFCCQQLLTYQGCGIYTVRFWNATCTMPRFTGMMTSSNGNIFRVTGPLCGKFTGHWWIPRIKASDAELWCFPWSAPWIKGWVNNREASDLRRQSAHYDIIVMDLGFHVLLEIFIRKKLRLDISYIQLSCGCDS